MANLHARRFGVPAAILFASNAKAVPVYGSGGWLSYTDEQLADDARRFADLEFDAGESAGNVPHRHRPLACISDPGLGEQHVLAQRRDLHHAGA